MKTTYRHSNTSVSMVNFHLVFCPRFRRKIFLIDGVEARFKELVHQICEQSVLRYIDPISSVFFGAFFLGESIGFSQIIGGSLVLIATILALLQFKMQQKIK